MLGFSWFWDTIDGFEQEKSPKCYDFRGFGILLMALSKKSLPNAMIFVVLGYY